jgi:hypothetical protein
MPVLVGECNVEDCDKVSRLTKGMCTKHYERERRSGRYNTCSVGGCESGVMGKGLCGSHYYRMRNNLPLETEWRRAGEWQQWETTTKGYVRRRRTDPGTGKRENQMQHVYLMEQHLGRCLQPHEEVHHKNGVRSDNRLENLELWNTRQPKGQRPEDKVEYALEILKLYRPDLLA